MSDRQLKKKKKKKRSVIPAIILVIAICCFAYSAFQLGRYAWETYLTNKTRSEVAAMVDVDTSADDETYTDQAAADKAAMMKKYGKIYKKNHDFIGWLKVDGTAIDNPVMFTPNDKVNGQYYLRKNFYGNYDIGGTLFVDYRCTLDPAKGVSTDTIIYGHRMRNETMFGPLRYFKDPEFCKKHTSIQFDTIYRPGRYVLFAALLAKATDGDAKAFKYYDFINAATEKDLTDYLKQIKASAHYYDEANAPKFGDEIITLSTCDYYTTNGRLVILGKRVD